LDTSYFKKICVTRRVENTPKEWYNQSTICLLAADTVMHYLFGQSGFCMRAQGFLEDNLASLFRRRQGFHHFSLENSFTRKK
jgi:hypothetical protein